MKSTTARVDAAAIAARPCFLCAANLPAEQEGIAFGEEWVVLANPFPILPGHLTIVHRRHVPQRLAGRMDAMLQLARGLPRSFVIYNGPQCGASAPDHLHFQACERSLFPIGDVTPPGDGAFVIEEPCRALVVRQSHRAGLAADVERLLKGMDASQGAVEPMVNVAAYWADERFSVYVFPRAKHRPDAYHTGELLVSPAAIDLCGVLVAPRAADFEALTYPRVRAIYDEVMAPGTALETAARQIGWRP